MPPRRPCPSRPRGPRTDRLLDGGFGLQVRSWLSAGYLLSDRVGRTTHAADLDTLWRAAGQRGARPKDWRPLRGADTTVSVEAPGGWDLATAAVWFAAVARSQPDTSLEITLPDPGGARTLLVTIDSGAVRATAVTDSGDGPPPEATAVVSGAGASMAARHLEKFGGRRPRRRA
ncbi:hypothetical protein ACFVH9_16210 [Streptomyces hirsutus]|uniref:hypothetical protein n=1 Tax=Streptomyces hirsutus TaxID=35620 RepID=UPI00362DCE23